MSRITSRVQVGQLEYQFLLRVMSVKQLRLHKEYLTSYRKGYLKGLEASRQYDDITRIIETIEEILFERGYSL